MQHHPNKTLSSPHWVPWATPFRSRRISVPSGGDFSTLNSSYWARPAVLPAKGFAVSCSQPAIMGISGIRRVNQPSQEWMRKNSMAAVLIFATLRKVCFHSHGLLLSAWELCGIFHGLSKRNIPGDCVVWSSLCLAPVFPSACKKQVNKAYISSLIYSGSYCERWWVFREITMGSGN